MERRSAEDHRPRGRSASFLLLVLSRSSSAPSIGYGWAPPDTDSRDTCSAKASCISLYPSNYHQRNMLLKKVYTVVKRTRSQKTKHRTTRKAKAQRSRRPPHRRARRSVPPLRARPRPRAPGRAFEATSFTRQEEFCSPSSTFPWALSLHPTLCLAANFKLQSFTFAIVIFRNRSRY